MQGVRGNNDFNGTFDFFEWSAKYYMKPREVIRAISKMHIKGKDIKRINVIGYGSMPTGRMHETIANAGIKLYGSRKSRGSIWSYPHIDDVRVPWEVIVCEPIQIVFEDNTTLEILPIGEGGARVAENSIPIGLTDGLNHSNFDSNVLFSEAIGKKITDLKIYIDTSVTEYVSSWTLDRKTPYKEERTRYRYKIELNTYDSFEIETENDGWYTIAMSRGGKIPYARIKEAKKDVNQEIIVNGFDSGGVFWIVPICSNKETDNNLFFTQYYGMSVYDYLLLDYLGDLLHRYFDPAIQDEDDCGRCIDGKRVFDDYGVNLYTFDSVRKMLDDISHIIEALENDADDPMTEKLKKQFKWRRYTDKKPDELTEAEIDEIRLKERLKAIDFYKRFSKRMEAMMKLPGRDIISFSGP